MTRRVEFNSSNWRLLLDYSAGPIMLGENTYIPLPPVETSTILENHIIACRVQTTIPQNRNWQFGGLVEQRLIAGIVLGTATNTAGERQKLWIDRLSIILFPKITANYSLKFYIPRWFRDVHLTAWEYTGVDDTLESITLAEEFSNINFKLDQLLNT